MITSTVVFDKFPTRQHAQQFIDDVLYFRDGERQGQLLYELKSSNVALPVVHLPWEGTGSGEEDEVVNLAGRQGGKCRGWQMLGVGKARRFILKKEE